MSIQYETRVFRNRQVADINKKESQLTLFAVPSKGLEPSRPIGH